MAAIKVTASSGVGAGHVRQNIQFVNSADGEWPTTVRLRGCSRPFAVTGCGSGSAGCDGYSLSAMAVAVGNAASAAVVVPFDPSALGYHCREAVVSNPAGIQEIQVSASFQGAGGGAAAFDDFDATVTEPHCWGERAYCRGVRSTWAGESVTMPPTPSPTVSPTSSFVTVVFQIDMRGWDPNTAPSIRGPMCCAGVTPDTYNPASWCECNADAFDEDGDGIYSLHLELLPMTSPEYSWRPSINQRAPQSRANGHCASAYGNYGFTIETSDLGPDEMVLPVVCFGNISAGAENNVADGECGECLSRAPYAFDSVVIDSDLDGTVDAHDGCPEDDVKVDPGACGCGNSEVSGCCLGCTGRLLVSAKSDEFDDGILDSTKWSPAGGNGFNSEYQYFRDTPENINVTADGVLALTMIKEDFKESWAECRGPPDICMRSTEQSWLCQSNALNCAFTSGRIQSEGKLQFGFGYAEARVRSSRANGLWPAFWAMGGPINGVSEPWPRKGEIDIAEFFNYPEWSGGGGAHTAKHVIHYQTDRAAIYDPATRRYAGASVNPYRADGQWHTYGVEKLPGNVSFYVDNELKATVSCAGFRVALPDGSMADGASYQSSFWPFNAPSFFIFNLAANPTVAAGMALEDFDDRETFDVDWLRVWESPAETHASEHYWTQAGLDRSNSTGDDTWMLPCASASDPWPTG